MSSWFTNFFGQKQGAADNNAPATAPESPTTPITGGKRQKRQKRGGGCSTTKRRKSGKKRMRKSASNKGFLYRQGG